MRRFGKRLFTRLCKAATADLKRLGFLPGPFFVFVVEVLFAGGFLGKVGAGGGDFVV
jgi:hypothetical protein